ncbi:peptide-binding protein [Methylophilaceae bacterium]|jgi:peptide/nickel transport system substrate-binding protein|nr:peptide-binding protein [Methylophilaceae bacterium]|tara:strand:+ start:5056 stop:6705 length:1650 start_codon:yes stop_codon:yes gene_type:complete
MKKKSILLNIFALLFGSLILISCSKESSEIIDFNKEYNKINGGSLINAMAGEPSNLIAMIAGDSASSQIAGNIFNSLIKYDENLNYAPDIAASWEISNNQKTITFNLKKNLKWADGKPLTSSDVLFTWQLITNPNTRTPYASDYQLVKNASAPDPLTFKVTYETSYAPALDTWSSLHILPKHILRDEDINNTFFSRKPTGSSYYKLGSWVNGQQVTLEANDKSISGVPLIKKLISRIIPDTSSQFLELTADNIDLMNINPIQYQRVFPARKDLRRKIELYKELGNGYTYLGFNLKKEPFNDIRVRQALNYAIDKDEVIKGVLLGLGEPISSPYKPGTRWNNPNLTPYPYKPSKALQLLKEAGFKENKDGLLTKNGNPLKFEIITNQNKQREMTAVVIQKRLQEIGVEVSIRVIEWASFVNRFIKTGDFDVVVLGWSLSLDPDQYNIWHSSQQGPGQFNFLGYSNKKVDKLLELGRKELNISKRERIYHKFSKYLLEDSPIVYLYAGYGLSAVHKRVKGIKNPAPPAGIYHNNYDWFVPEPLRRNEISIR